MGGTWSGNEACEVQEFFDGETCPGKTWKILVPCVKPAVQSGEYEACVRVSMQSGMDDELLRRVQFTGAYCLPTGQRIPLGGHMLRTRQT